MDDAQFTAHMKGDHPEEYRKMMRSLREIDDDIRAAQRQAGYPVDDDIDDIDPDDDDLSDIKEATRAGFNP